MLQQARSLLALGSFQTGIQIRCIHVCVSVYLASCLSIDLPICLFVHTHVDSEVEN